MTDWIGNMGAAGGQIIQNGKVGIVAYIILVIIIYLALNKIAKLKGKLPWIIAIVAALFIWGFAGSWLMGAIGGYVS